MTMLPSSHLCPGGQTGEEEKEDGPGQASHPVQQALCERCAHLRKEEGTQRQLLSASVAKRRNSGTTICQFLPS